MQKKIIVKIHSFIDVITNSSTEIFVTETDKEVKEVEAILKEKWELFKKLYPDCYNSSLPLSGILTVNKATKEEVKDYIESWGDCHGKDMMKEGDVLITGTGDNEIPYKFFDVIEDIFNAKGFHLG